MSENRQESGSVRTLLAAGALVVTVGTWGLGIWPRAADPVFPIALGALVVWLVYVVREPGRGRWMGMLLAYIAVGATLLGAEVILRVGFGDVFFRQPDRHLLHRWPRLPLVFRYDANARMDGTTYGDLAALTGDPQLRIPRPLIFQTDAHGFRNDPASEGPYDLLVLGDSYALGAGTTEDSTWARRLSSAYGLATYNLAVPGSPWQSYVNLAVEGERLALRPGGTVLLMLFTGNDLDEAYGPVDSLAQLPWQGALGRLRVAAATVRGRSVIRHLRGRLVRSLVRGGQEGDEGEPPVVARQQRVGPPILFFGSYVARSRRTEADVRAHPHFDDLLASLKALAAWARQREAHFKIALAPSKADVYRWLLAGAAAEHDTTTAWSPFLAEFCAAQQLDCLDLTPVLAREARRRYDASGGLLWWPDDTHWNAEGHALVAATLYDRLLCPPDPPPSAACVRPAGE